MSQPTRKQLANAVLALLDKGQAVDKVAKELAGYLIESRRTRELNALVRELEQLRYRRDGILEPDVTSAKELTDEVKNHIKDLFGAKKTMLNLVSDPEVVGGVRVRALDKQLDLTVQSKLKHLKQMKVGV